MNTFKFLAFLLAAGALVSACGHQGDIGSAEQSGDARLEIETRIDMGDFEGPNFKKFTNVFFRNTGSDTLIVYAVTPMCDCTEVILKDTVLAPGQMGIIEAYLDLSAYPVKTTEKEFSIWSNNADEKEVFVTLVGTKK